MDLESETWTASPLFDLVDIDRMLTQTPRLQLCLAHYCDLHGPTPLMVTEGLPVPCSTCYEEGLQHDHSHVTDRPAPSATAANASAHAVAAAAEALRRMDLGGGGAMRSSSAPVSEEHAQEYRASLRRVSQTVGTCSAVETPPESPQIPSGPPTSLQEKRRSDSGFRKTYDDYVTRRAGPCDNCALTLPKRQESSKDANPEPKPEQGPTLRTRAPFARVFSGGMGEPSPPTSQTSSSIPSEDESTTKSRPSHRRTGTTASLASRSSSSSAQGVTAHTHYLDYTSTHEPVAASSFSIVRASCLRTLSLETLPRPPATGYPSSGANPAITPSASPSTPAFVTTHSVGAAASGGPIFFGDPSAGYTTAYIFRIPDVHARGHKRVYAFLALSTHRERLAMKTFGFVAAAFRDMATWIQTLAEQEAERSLQESSANSPVMPGGGPGYGGLHSEPAAPASHIPTAGGPGGGSSFLMGGGGLSRRMGSGFSASGVALKQRGLAELVGLPDFFIELHARFVKLLLELRVVLGS
ncbi:vesicle coat protein [Copromyces sp. CBS 386.78]|nr:vesicle coat protein [Copromyces sp. CBS 386.78]